MRVRISPRARWILIGVLGTVLIGVGIFLGFSYIPGKNCTPHAMFVGQTVIEYCL